MTVVVYPALMEARGEPTTLALHARIVDFPGLEVSAAGQADLIHAARERLSAELQRLEAAGDTWPQPTALDALAVTSGGSVILVDVSVDDTPVRLNISLGERLLKRIDHDAEARSMTRSGYLALGARRLLEETAQSADAVGGEASRKLQEEVAALGRRVNEAVGPDSHFGRTLAELDAMALDGLRRLGGEVQSALRSKPRRPERAPSHASNAEPHEPPVA